MKVELKPVTLDGQHDNEGMLVFREGRLTAVMSCLGKIHGRMQGRWFVEATFRGMPERAPPTFASLRDAELWIAGE